MSGLQIARQLCTLNVREGEEKYHRKANRETETSSQQSPPLYIKAVSKTKNSSHRSQTEQLDAFYVYKKLCTC